MPTPISDYLVLGGGLGGLAAAYVLALAGADVVLIDRSLPEANGALGGFTRFSGAKFSLLPAGQGLVPVAGGVENLQQVIGEVLNFCGLSGHQAIGSRDLLEDKPSAAGTNIRTYQSLVLTPSQIEHTVQLISSRIRRLVRVIDAEVLDIEHHSSRWVALGGNGKIAEGRNAVFAGGRTAGSLLRRAGATPQEGKGVDLGVRVRVSRTRRYPLTSGTRP